MAAAGSCSTDVVYYLPSWTDDGSTGNDGTLNAQTDDRPTRGRWTDGRLNQRQRTDDREEAQWTDGPVKKSLIGLSIDSDLSLKSCQN